MSERCPWAKGELEIAYHDNEWGRPLHDDRKLFELLVLESMQAGLSWATILAKRDTMRLAFDHYDAKTIIKYNDAKINTLLQNPGIIRNRAKLNALVANAAAYLKIKHEYGTFDRYIWSFVNDVPIINTYHDPTQIPAKTDLSDTMSKQLKAKGFKFMGSTTCYAFMQAAGLVNDHMTWCRRWKTCQQKT